MTNPTTPGPEVPTPPLTATVLKRIADAVDGDRSGQLVFVVVNTDETHLPLFAEVVPVSGDDIAGASAQASARAAELGPTYVAVGPYQTQRDRDDKGQPISSVVFFMVKQPDSKMHLLKGPAALVDDIESVTVSLTLKEGRQAIGDLSATFQGPLEAIFLTMSGMDKFFYPYLTALYSPQLANRQREGLIARIGRTETGGSY